MLRSPLALCAVLGLALWPGLARAHPDIDEGRRHLDAAEFEAAVEAFDRAERAERLTRDELVELYERRAVAHHARRSVADMNADLVRLSLLAPDHEPSVEIMPSVRRAFEQARAELPGPLTVSLDVTPGPAGVEVRVEVDGDVGGLVRRVYIFARDRGGWRRVIGTRLSEPSAPGERHAFYAAAVGPGGVVVASAGSEDRPREVTIPGGAGEPGGPPRLVDNPYVDPSAEGPSDGPGAWPWVVAGAGLAAAVGVVLAIVLAGGTSDLTQPSRPTRVE